MRLILAQIGNNKTVKFAVKELIRLIKAMDGTVTLDIRKYEEKDSSVKNALWVGFDGSVKANNDEDSIYISVENGAGIISGSNERSVLMAAYRFMKEMGCRYLYPGKDGEKIPQRHLCCADLTAEVREKASYKHRGICIEGAVGCEHVYNTIDWLPKVGMNAFFTQFFTPGVFFRKYYERFYSNGNDRDFKNELTNKDIDAMVDFLYDEIKERGLIYHAVGHGWNCKPFGFDDSGWEVYEGEISDDVRSLLALRNGKREFYGGKPKDTQLCYSNPFVQNKITDSIVEYCENNKNVDYLHFWLADGALNHCECEECVKKRPTDYYVDMLNMLDEKLTAKGIDTKIVFLIYTELLFAPLKETVKNTNRFTLMFAPINRWYAESYGDVDLNSLPELPVYERNKEFPRHKDALNVAYLKEWQRSFKGDSFVFDYHLMWNHHRDPGYYNVAEFLHKDMTALHKIGLNGMVSCQLLRSAFPTGLPQYAMAAGLWDKNGSFESVRDEYFTAAFGNEAKAVSNYLKELSNLFNPNDRAKLITKADYIACYEKAKDVIKAFFGKYLKQYKNKSNDWEYLAVHAELTNILSDMYIALYGDDKETVKTLKEKFIAAVKENEEIIDTVCDEPQYCETVCETYLKRRV